VRQDSLAVAVVVTTSGKSTKKKRLAGLAPGVHFLMMQRPCTGLLPSLWEFPSSPLTSPSASSKDRQLTMDQYVAKATSGAVCLDHASVISRDDLGTVSHLFSHIRWTMHVETAEVVDVDTETAVVDLERESSDVKWKWVSSADLHYAKLPVSSAMIKVLRLYESSRTKA